MIAQLTHYKYSEAEFEKLQHVTAEALMESRKLVSRDGDVAWYVLYDTPEGKYLTVLEIDAHGIRKTHCFPIKYVHMWFKLAPEA